MYRLTTAPFRALEAQWIADLAAARAKDPFASLLVLIPTGRLRTHLQRQWVREHRGLLNVHVLTLYGLAERILLDPPAPEGRVLVEPALDRELIRDLLEGRTAVPFQLRGAFLGAGEHISRGLPGALAGTLKDLRDAGADVTHALKAALEGHFGPEGGTAAPTLELYAHVYSVFRKLGLRTTADVLRAAAERAATSRFVRTQHTVFLYGFYDMTGVQLDLALALAGHADAHAYVPTTGVPAADAFAERLLLDPAVAGKSVRQPLDVPSTPHRAAETFTSCSGARDEIWFVAKEIQRLLDDGVEAGDIAVVARTLSPYFSVLRDVFGSHHIPYAASAQEPAGAHPWLKRIRARLEEADDTPTATWSAHAAWAQTLIDPAESDAGALLREQTLAPLTALAGLDVLGAAVPRRRFIDAWEEKLDALEMPAPINAGAGVQVLDVQQARGLRFKAVFLIGLNEKTFPRLIREDPFLSDAARSGLSQALGARLGRKMDGYQEERFLFELMRQTADAYLYFVWQRSDEEGKALIPSVYVQELLRATKAKPVRLARSLPEKLKQRPAAGLTPKELSYIINRAGADPQALYRALGWNIARFQALLQAHRAAESFRPGILALDGLIADSPTLRRILAKGYSPSGLEDLAACPYQFYAAHVLRIPVPEDPAPGGDIASSALGKLFHRALELYFGHRDLARACDQAVNEFHAAYPQVYAVVLKSSKQLIFNYLSEFLKSDLEELGRSGYALAYAEQSLEGPVAELGADLARVPFRGRVDRIDLKNVDGRWVGRVVDYKSGKARKVAKLENALLQGSFLQLPIYMGLVRTFLTKEKGAETTVESAALRWLRADDSETPAPELWDSFWTTPPAALFRENMKGLIEIADSGHFYIVSSSGEWGHCSRCHFARVCRKEHMPTRARAEQDPVHRANAERLKRTAKDAE